MDEQVYTLLEYCAAEKVSRSHVYQEWARGEGVEYYKRGNKVLISHTARIRHREKLEQRERERRAKAAKAAA